MILVSYRNRVTTDFMTDHYIATVEDASLDLSQLASQFLGESSKKQLSLIPQLASLGEPGWNILLQFLQSYQAHSPSLVAGKIYQTLWQVTAPNIQDFLQNQLPTGVVRLESERNLDYQPLQDLLIRQDWQAADSLTRQTLCELAGEAAIQRKWLYFTEVEQFPVADLHTLNSLWWVYSEGKFSFSVQRRIWLSVEKNFVKLWPIIGWKKDNNWTQYPHEFTWNLSAPVGHLPLLNQLRGVRVIASLFAHHVWTKHHW